MTHQFPVRVYYEDTDLAGIVYYANYLKFIERGRSEWVRSIGINQDRMKQDEGLIFVVRRVEADYLIPARYDDELIVETEVIQLGSTFVELNQKVLRGSDTCFTAVVKIVLINNSGRPARIPAELRPKLSAG
ncbi:tol-pal system-associated acyl-CoA thioesterase [Actibacterium pelagium]|uniref:Tol-pal system-associated acyl-CoA thioesterase n=1 Tax=Actibacterium pelagium TaxID=2029103 RepID=A0A917EME3_9RHOB|nr:tol-pal system-associated acyl-CoA thioesterase [Actibacterium pelagium]GGE60330.1 tol-pal system-associated acyl-CoA thioesterase [Actibacterium pelagium]